MQDPPWGNLRQRRIVPNPRWAVNCAALLALATLLGAPGRAGAAPTTGDVRLFAIFGGFPDRPLPQPREHFIGRPNALLDRLVAYYSEVSAGRLRLRLAAGQRAITLPSPRHTYVQRPAALASDAAAVFADYATQADRAALREAAALIVFFTGPGRESRLGTPEVGDPWSNYTPVDPPARVGDASFAEACVIAAIEAAPFDAFGVLCHEYGHLLGLPELYAPGAATHEGIGVWGLMGQGTWLGRGSQPSHPSAWEKVRLGWVDVETIERTTRGVKLPAVEVEPRVIKIPAVPGRPQEYYLLENRARIGADRALPGEGLLVWHVDESVEGFRTAQNDPAHKLLHLVEADGRGDLDRGHAAGGNRGDASDPWSGPPRWRQRVAGPLLLAGALGIAGALFRLVRPHPLVPVLLRLGIAALLLSAGSLLRRTPVCGPDTPGMPPYDGSPARVVIRNISPPGRTMTFDVLVAPN
jgi:immune inhibitor A